MDLKFDIDIASIIKDLKEFGAEVGRDLQKAVAQLAASTHAKTVELANEELVDTKQQFMDSLSFEEIAPNIWVVSVDESGLWIEEGLPNNFDMKPGLLKNAQTSKSGTRYKVIPVDYGRNPTQMTDKAHDLIDYLKSSLKKEKIPFRRIERNPDGSP